MLHHDRPVVDDALTLAEDRRRRGLRTKLVNFSWFENSQSSTERLDAFDGLAPRDGSTAATLREAGHDVFPMTDLAVHQTLRMIRSSVFMGVTTSCGPQMPSRATSTLLPAVLWVLMKMKLCV